LIAIINAAMAKQFFPDQDPLGQQISVVSGHMRRIVGIVGDVKHYTLERDAPVQTYEPLAQKPWPHSSMTFVVRTTGKSVVTPAAFRAAIYEVDKDQPIATMRPLTSWIGKSIARQRFGAFLFIVFSSVALLLASLGIYGVMAFFVTQRTGEFGIRMALGAQTEDVLRMVFRQGGRLLTLGLTAGLIGAWLLTRFLASLLFGISPHDPTTFAAIAALISCIAALACLLPARRATKMDPMTALRAE
jgi:putative ABC transport system permease protein